jgi:ribosomal protein S18 acetylase RimI-like enzyme
MTVLSKAEPADVEAIAALCAEMDEFYGDETAPLELRLSQIRAALFADPPAAWALLARGCSELAGFASYSFLWPAAGLTTSMYLKELYVAAAFRQSGIGSLLMRGLYRIAAERGCSRVEWTTDQDNTEAQEFYEALGAKPTTSKIFYRVAGDELSAQARVLSLEAGELAAQLRLPVRRHAVPQFSLHCHPLRDVTKRSDTCLAVPA